MSSSLFCTYLAARGITSPPDHMIRAVGIDLGTTNSSVSEVVWPAGASSSGVVRTIQVDQKTPMGTQSHVLVPSIVCIKGGEVLVGEGAKVERSLMANPGLGWKQNKNIFWECKNHMGLSRTYHQAPAGFRSAPEIGGHVLRFLMDAVKEEDATPIGHAVVTVPASFRASQREATIQAASAAGLSLGGSDLVDEPVAAFLDYVFSCDTSALDLHSGPKTLLIFDFGGGTCDVAIFRISMNDTRGVIQLSPLTVSRYHRLGGGDIDLAIVHEILMPQILAQNGLNEYDLSYEDKAHGIAPAFLGIAESLKIGLCLEIEQLKRLGKYAYEEDKVLVVKTHPGVHKCTLKSGQTLTLTSPVLHALEFEKLLIPFLEKDLLYARESEYRMTCSIFAPLTDAMNRAGLDAERIDYCLMAGGSSFIPQVQETVDSFFINGYVLNFDSAERAKTAISRGAAYHALAVALTGQGLIQPVANDGVMLQTNSGPVEMVPAGAPLPFPGPDTWGEVPGLLIPKDSPDESMNIKLSLSTADGSALYNGIWKAQPPLKRGEEMRFRFRMDENQVMRLDVNLASQPPGEYWNYEIENPLNNIEFNQSARATAEEIEENLRIGAISAPERAEAMMKAAQLRADLGQRDLAIAQMGAVLAAKGGRDSGVLNNIGILHGERHDYVRQEKFYREAASMSPSWGTPLFNLALSQRARGLKEEALVNIEAALKRQLLGPFLVLRARLADDLGDPIKRDSCLKQSIPLFGALKSMSDWELGWYITAVFMLDDKARAEEAQAEKMQRGRPAVHDTLDGFLPDRRPA